MRFSMFYTADDGAIQLQWEKKNPQLPAQGS